MSAGSTILQGLLPGCADFGGLLEEHSLVPSDEVRLGRIGSDE
jgi:hypothetical protein